MFSTDERVLNDTRICSAVFRSWVLGVQVKTSNQIDRALEEKKTSILTISSIHVKIKQ
jgi:hypothetical protein